MKKLATLISAMILVFSVSAGVGEPKFDHSAWDNLLQKNVSVNGNVNYEGLKANRAVLNKYLMALSKNVPDASWDRNNAMAYWINAYNAFTVDLILKNYPLKSIMNLHGGKAWDVKFIELGGKKYSLNQIEHDILRGKYKDERIHFAVNCASFSCPKLLNGAFFANDLDKQLEKATIAFINNPAKNSVNGKRVQISELFNWYKGDFMEYGSVLAYINHYSKVKADEKARITYKPYNWNLNK